MNQIIGRVKIARIKKEYIPYIGFGVVDAIILKHGEKYYRICSYGKRISQKGRRFSSKRWILRNSISISSFRNHTHLLEECLYRTKIEDIRLTELQTLFSHYHGFLRNCGVHLEINLIEDFDVIFS